MFVTTIYTLKGQTRWEAGTESCGSEKIAGLPVHRNHTVFLFTSRIGGQDVGPGQISIERKSG